MLDETLDQSQTLLLNALLWDMYGKVSVRRAAAHDDNNAALTTGTSGRSGYNYTKLESYSLELLISISAHLRVQLRLTGPKLAKYLIRRDSLKREQYFLNRTITCELQRIASKAGKNIELKFTLTPPPSPSPPLSTTSSLLSPTGLHQQQPQSSDPPPTTISAAAASPKSSSTDDFSLIQTEEMKAVKKMAVPESAADYNQWLHAMKMVAGLPGGMPPEFRRKLWLALAERHLQNLGIDWGIEEEKCLCDNSRADDEELGAQIVKDLHRTGSSLCSGPSGTINQAKLKRILLGYARWNPEVGYCQGFNMLGALILQVMDKNESHSIKIMIFLIEAILPSGYFCGSLGGLQADMAVFRDLLGTKLPRLAKHLQKLQGPAGEGTFEPPLTNVFTMQWFLTLFCNCLPINCVLRVWDLILIEGSDVLLRCALALWGLLEDRILATRTADDFYCKMGVLSGDLLNGNVIDSNGLVRKIIELGPIQEVQKLRDKHLNNIAPFKDKKGLQIFYSDDEGDSDDDSRLAVATAWGVRSNSGSRRGSLGIPQQIKNATDGRERIALDISLLKKQYEKLRERQRQAHIILTAACARQPSLNSTAGPSLQMNQLLIGKNAILSSKGRRIGAPQGAVPPARTMKQAKPNLKTKAIQNNKKKGGETLHWKDTDETIKRRNSIKWKDVSKDIKSEFEESPVKRDGNLSKSPSVSSSISNASDTASISPNPKRKSESSSYSEESDSESSTSTSLCDDENLGYSAASSLEASPLKKRITAEVIEVPEEKNIKLIDATLNTDCKSELAIVENFEIIENILAKNIELLENSGAGPAVEDSHNSLNTIKEEEIVESKTQNDVRNMPSTADVKIVLDELVDTTEGLSEIKDENISPIDSSDQRTLTLNHSMSSTSNFLSSPEDLKSLSLNITSTSQLSPIPDISKYISMSSISPLRTPSSIVDYSDYVVNMPVQSSTSKEPVAPSSSEDMEYKVSDEGVTNEFFERINSAERPNKLDLPEYIIRRDTTNFTLDSEKSDNTSRLENYSLTNISSVSPLSYAIELPIKASLQTDSPLLPPCTDISIITAEKSPLIHENSMEKTDTDADLCSSKGEDVNFMQTANRDNSSEELELYLCNRNRYMKEKSFSMDETATEAYEIDEFTRRSNSEGIVSVDNRNNDRIMKIIEENSMILGRIVRKSSAVEHAESFDVISNRILEQPELEKCADEPEHLDKIDSVYESITSLNPKLDSFMLLEKSPSIVEESPSSAQFVSSTIEAAPESNESHMHDHSFQRKSIYDEDGSETAAELSTVESTIIKEDPVDSDKAKSCHEFKKTVEKNPFSPLAERTHRICESTDMNATEKEQPHSLPLNDNHEKNTEVKTSPVDEKKISSIEVLAERVDSKDAANIVDGGKTCIDEVKVKSHYLKETEKNPFSPLEEKPPPSESKAEPQDESDENNWTFVDKPKINYTTEKNPFSPLELKVSPRLENIIELELDDDEELDTVPNYLTDTDRKYSSDTQSDELNKPGKKMDVDEKFISELSFGRAKSQEKLYSPHSDLGVEDFEMDLDIPESGKLGEEDSLVYSKIVDEINLLKSPEKSPPLPKSEAEPVREAKPTTFPIQLNNVTSPFGDLDLSKFSPAVELKKINFDLKTPTIEIKRCSPSADITLSRIHSNPEFSVQKDYSFKKSSDKVFLENDILTTNISETISSIENTIKSIDSFCPSEAELKSARINKTLDNLEKSLEKFSESNKKWENEKDKKKKAKLSMNPPPIVVLDDVVINASDDDFTSNVRISREIKRDTSPRRRRRDGDADEYESRMRRDNMSSPNQNTVAIKFDELPQNFHTIDRIIDDGLNDARDEMFSKRLDREIDKLSHSFDPAKCLHSDDYSVSLSVTAATRSPSPRNTSRSPNLNKVFPEKLEIRHTTVTSTFYDRFLSYKKEQNSKFEKSPLSPIITKSYLDSLKPNSNFRITKSAENSPSRSKFQSTNYHSSFLSPTATSPSATHDPTPSRNKYGHKGYDAPFTSYIKSCDNIPMMQQHVLGSSRIGEPGTSSRDSSTNNLHQYRPQPQQHSQFSYSPLPIKKKPPSELGINLGLYKNPTKKSPKS